MKKTTIYLPEELVIEVKAASRRERRPEAEIIREAIAKYMAEPERKRPKPKSIGIAHSGRIQSEHLEDWLAENWKRDW